MTEAMLAGIRVLDLSNEMGYLCGRVLGTLGADVVKVEKPGGDPSRSLGPYFRGQPHPERNLHWLAFNVNKRGITLDLEAEEGKELFRRLAARADFIIESFPPGYMETQGIGYSSMSRVNQNIILTSITPFGQSGPYRDLEASDLTLMALSGVMSLTGEPDQAPVRLPLDQGYYYANLHAAMATLAALHYREVSGEGQAVDISVFDCLIRANYYDPVRWEYEQALTQRAGPYNSRTRIATRRTWLCRDGYITWGFQLIPLRARENQIVAEWVRDWGGGDELAKVNWEAVDMNQPSLTQEKVDPWLQILEAFFARHTRRELEEEAGRRNVMLAGLAGVKDILNNEHLSARGFWTQVEHPELGVTMSYPGYLFKTSTVPTGVWRRAPLIGEHNREIYCEELGLTGAELDALQQKGVV